MSRLPLLVISSILIAGPSHATHFEMFEYQEDEQSFTYLVAFDSSAMVGSPGVLIVADSIGSIGDWRGVAGAVADYGYVVLIANLFDWTSRSESHERDLETQEKVALSSRDRRRKANLEFALRALKANRLVDSTKLSVIAFDCGLPVALNNLAASARWTWFMGIAGPCDLGQSLQEFDGTILAKRFLYTSLDAVSDHPILERLAEELVDRGVEVQKMCDTTLTGEYSYRSFVRFWRKIAKSSRDW